MATAEPDDTDELLDRAIPTVPPPPMVVRPDLSEPWYRPAKQFLRREQWNAGILQLLNRLRDNEREGELTLRYVGLPGQHHFDVLSMGGICTQKRLRLDYLGFRSGNQADARAVHLEELSILSQSRYFTARSITYPDSIEHIGRTNSIATNNFDQRGPFDIINLDVCGGILHGNTTPLLNAIKYVLSKQAQRQQPWLLYVTTAAKASDIAQDVITKFFQTVSSNCDRVERFRELLVAIAERDSLSLDESLRMPASLAQPWFLRLFTLAFGKWLLGNLGMNRPPAALSLHSVYCFRNTNRPEPEMLSLAYLVTPLIGGGEDPTGLTSAVVEAQKNEYEDAATELVEASIDGLLDLDEVWDKDPGLKQQVVSECERLLKLIGVDDDGLREWRSAHGLN